MLYQFYDFQHSVWSPFRHAAEKMEEVFRSPFMPVSYTPMGRAIAASCHLFERVTRRYIKPEFGLHTTEIDGKTVEVEEEVVLHKPFCELLHFKRKTKKEASAPFGRRPTFWSLRHIAARHRRSPFAGS